MLAAVVVVVFQDIDQFLSLEPLRELRLPLLGAAGIGGRDQSECGDVVGVLLTFGDPNRFIRRCGEQFR
jgi:hypothetical protein